MRTNKPLDFIASTRNIVGLSAAAVITAVTLPTGLAGSLWPLVTGAAYALGFAIAPGPKKLDVPMFEQGRDYTVEEMRQTLGRVLAEAPEPVRPVLGEINALCQEIFAKWPQVSQSLNVKYEMQVIVMDYLPTAVASYLRIPGTLRGRRQRGGKAPLDLLGDQLVALRDELDELRDAAYEDDVRALEVQGKLIAEKYRGGSSLDLDPLQ